MSSSTIKTVPPPRLICIETNPGPGKLHIDTKNKIIGFLEAGGTPSKAAKYYDANRSDVYKLKNKFEETGSVATRKGQGRKGN